MASPNGGRWVFSAADQPVVLGINNGIAPVFPQAQAGALNIEVFTNPTVAAGPVPVPNPDFVLSIADAGGTFENNFLTGASLQLGNGDYLAVDSVTGAATQSPSKIMLGAASRPWSAPGSTR